MMMMMIHFIFQALLQWLRATNLEIWLCNIIWAWLGGVAELAAQTEIL
jgi:hypothetical protein